MRYIKQKAFNCIRKSNKYYIDGLTSYKDDTYVCDDDLKCIAADMQ